jgi:hypothetical protein
LVLAGSSCVLHAKLVDCFVFRFSSLLFWGIAVAADASLMFEQVTRDRGSMMSLRVAFAGIGSAMVSVGLFRMLREHFVVEVVLAYSFGKSVHYSSCVAFLAVFN